MLAQQQEDAEPAGDDQEDDVMRHDLAFREGSGAIGGVDPEPPAGDRR
ncbi:hypothetical protein ACFQ4K_17310 [Tistrella bauzanensis]